jgi:hypothetical protein
MLTPTARKGQAGKPCRNWAKNGTCRYGDKCCFSHAAPDVPASEPEQAAMARIRLAEEKATKADKAALAAREDARRARADANECKREAAAATTTAAAAWKETAAAREAKERAAQCAGAATTRVLRLEGDADALRACSLDELRGIVGDIERGAGRAREALRTAESRAAAAEQVAESAFCKICLERPKDTALNCGHVLCGACAAQVQSCPE